MKLLQNPAQWAENEGFEYQYPKTASLGSILVRAYPELDAKREFYEQIWKELHFRGLVNRDTLNKPVNGDNLMAKQTTDIGDQFIKFISAPNDYGHFFLGKTTGSRFTVGRFETKWCLDIARAVMKVARRAAKR